jgi:hypothetical protein
MAIRSGGAKRSVLVLCAVMAAASAGWAGETKPGQYTVTIAERHPESAGEKMKARMKYAKAVEDYDLAKESFSLFIPNGYDGTAPYGVIVFINSDPPGEVRSRWKEVIEKYHILYIGANNSGNTRSVMHRYGMALDAANYMVKTYNVDKDRVYLGGFSGGGRSASMVAPHFPGTFTGAFYDCGCNFFREIPLKGNSYIPATFPPPEKERLELAKKNSRFVFCTSDQDFNLEDTKKVFDAYKGEGFKYCTFLQVPGQGHTDPTKEYFEKLVQALDEPLSAQAKQLYDDAAASDKAGKYGQAMGGYARAASRANGQEFGAKATARIGELKKIRQDEWDKAAAALAAKQYGAAVAGLEEIAKQFDDKEAKDKMAEIGKAPAIQGEIKSGRDKAEADRKEEAAKKDLDAAHELLAKNLTQGYDALVRAGKTHGGTASGAAAQAEAEKLKKERGGDLDKVANAKKAQSDLSMAKNYIKNNMPDMARDKLQGILQYAPGSAEAKEARELLGGL